MPTIRDVIIFVVDDEDELLSIEQLIDILQQRYGVGYNRAWVRRQINTLDGKNEITVKRNGTGRGHGARIRKNRNSPGYPRRSNNG